MSYSRDYKKRAVEYKRDHHTMEETRSVFLMSKSTYYKWEKEYDAGYPEKLKHTCEKKINKEALKRAIEERPDSELTERSPLWMHTASSILRTGTNGNHAKKKTFTYSEKSEEARIEYLAKVEDIPEGQMIYVDESGATGGHGGVPHGE